MSEATLEDETYDPLDDATTYRGYPLREWQKRALDSWENASYLGVVEAVTGTGKSLVGIAAIHHTVVRNGGKALVLVPTVALLEQWRRQVVTSLPTVRVGTLGGGAAETFYSNDVLIATVQSAYKNPPVPTSLGVLVADEVHRYGSKAFGQSLHPAYQRRLGLSGTFERQLDDGINDTLIPYFGPIITSYQYGQALAEDVVAPFHLAFVGTEFSPSERQEYEDATRKCDDAKKSLVLEYGYDPDWARFFPLVTEVAGSAKKEGRWDEEIELCQQYLGGFAQRRQLTAEASGKEALISQFRDAFADLSGTLVFTETVDSARRLAWICNQATPSIPLTSESPADERRQKLTAFERGQLKVLCAPRILDEGIDVPEAELAVIIGASRTRRQMIQRMGRVIRKKRDGRSARILITYVIGTGEDPSLGGHESFVDQIEAHASSIIRPAGDVLQEIRDWLSP